MFTLEVLIFYSTIDLKRRCCQSDDAFAFRQLNFALADIVKQVIVSLVQDQKILISHIASCLLQPNDRNNLNGEKMIQVAVNLLVGLVKDVRGEANKNALH